MGWHCEVWHCEMWHCEMWGFVLMGKTLTCELDKNRSQTFLHAQSLCLECVRSRCSVNSKSGKAFGRCSVQMVFLTWMRARDAACSRAFSCRLVRVVPSRSSLMVGATRSYACRGSRAAGGTCSAAAAAAAAIPAPPPAPVRPAAPWGRRGSNAGNRAPGACKNAATAWFCRNSGALKDLRDVCARRNQKVPLLFILWRSYFGL